MGLEPKYQLQISSSMEVDHIVLLANLSMGFEPIGLKPLLGVSLQTIRSHWIHIVK